MIQHLVLFRFKQGVCPEDARVRQAIRLTSELGKHIPFIRSWQHGANVIDDPDAWDYGVSATFDDEAALVAYFEHPAHQPVLAAWSEVATLGFCDFRL